MQNIREVNLKVILRLAVVLLILFCLGMQSYAADTKEAPVNPLTVSGRVFVDANSNGALDAEEKGLADVSVSDGLRVVRTDNYGFYRLDGVDRKKNRFAFVVTPSGYKNTSKFYSRYPSYLNRHTANFALASDPKSHDGFTFAHITDIHVEKECETLKEDLDEIAGLKPAFAVATGDLVNVGKDKPQLETYWQGIKDSKVPVVNVPGNHDVNSGNENYEEILGPTHYSFNYAGYHFAIVNCVNEKEIQAEWLKNDLDSLPKGTPIMVFQHYPPEDKMMEFLSNYNTLGHFSGHWHTTKTFPYGNKTPILYVNSATLRFGGIDTSPRGYVLATLKNGKLAIEHRFSGLKKHLALVAPVNGGTVASTNTDVIAASYDSGAQVQLDYRIDNGPWKKMTQAGKMTWTAKERNLAVGKHDIAIRAKFDNASDPLENKGSFEATNTVLAVPHHGHDWPMFKHDHNHSGLAEDTVNPPLHLSWVRPLGAVTHIASPIVIGDTVYMGAADDDLANLSGVYAIDAVSGAIKWNYRTNSPVKNSVAFENGKIFGATVDGQIFALDAKTGKNIWQKDVGSSCARWVFGAPVVKDGVVYAGSAAKFAAFNAADGKQVWSASTASDWISCYSSLAVSGDIVYVGSNWNKGLFGIDKQTGEVKLQNSTATNNTHSTPVIADGKLFYANNKHLHALDPSSGTEYWASPLPGVWPISSPSVKGDRVVVGSGDGKLYCMDVATGKEQWNFETDEPLLFFGPYDRTAKPVVSSPAISGDTVYFGGVDGHIYAIELATGKKLWEYNLGVPVNSSPAVSGNSIFVSTFDGTVYAFSKD